MKKYLKLLTITVSILFLFLSFNVKAESSLDKLLPKSDKLDIYLFYGKTCPHCHDELKFLDQINDKYKDKLSIHKYEVWNDVNNEALYARVRDYFKVSGKGVPFTVIGDDYFYGYSESIGLRIEKSIREKLGYKEEREETSVVEKNIYKLPLIGEVDASKASLVTVAVVLGFVDGFNPCALWVLLFIINMLIGMKNKKKMFVLGYSFLLASAIVYFLAMLGINFVLSFAMLFKIRATIGLIAVILGIYSIYKYIETRNDSGCEVVNDKKRMNLSRQIKKIKNSSTFIGSLLGIIALAIGVNLIELTCSLGFPTIFSEILAINKVVGLERIVYLLIYVFMYMLDDLIIFTIAVLTYEVTAGSTKYGKIMKLVGGIIMIIMGLLLVFKPEWIMLNFGG